MSDQEKATKEALKTKAKIKINTDSL